MNLKASDTLVHVADAAAEPRAEVVALQPLAVVDHLCSVTEDTLRSVVSDPGGIGGSRRISQQVVQEMLAQIGEFHSKAGGSNANTIRGELVNLKEPCFLPVAVKVDSSISYRACSRVWGSLRTGKFQAGQYVLVFRRLCSNSTLLQIGARGKDEWGAMFASSMKRASVGMSKMRIQQGTTGDNHWVLSYHW